MRVGGSRKRTRSGGVYACPPSHEPCCMATRGAHETRSPENWSRSLTTLGERRAGVRRHMRLSVLPRCRNRGCHQARCPSPAAQSRGSSPSARGARPLVARLRLMHDAATVQPCPTVGENCVHHRCRRTLPSTVATPRFLLARRGSSCRAQDGDSPCRTVHRSRLSVLPDRRHGRRAPLHRVSVGNDGYIAPSVPGAVPRPSRTSPAR